VAAAAGARPTVYELRDSGLETQVHYEGGPWTTYTIVDDAWVYHTEIGLQKAFDAAFLEAPTAYAHQAAVDLKMRTPDRAPGEESGTTRDAARGLGLDIGEAPDPPRPIPRNGPRRPSSGDGIRDVPGLELPPPFERGGPASPPNAGNTPAD
jgi:hypothetical protein